MEKRFLLVLTACVLISSMVGVAHANLIELSFEVTGLLDFYGGSSTPPQDPVGGSIVYEAAFLGAPIISLKSVNMTIDSHAYTLGELNFTSPYSGMYDMIYAGTSSNVYSHTNDFWLIFDRYNERGWDFAYSTSNQSGIWGTSQVGEFPSSELFTSFTLTDTTNPPPDSGPVPGAVLLGTIGASLVGLLRIRRTL